MTLTAFVALVGLIGPCFPLGIPDHDAFWETGVPRPIVDNGEDDLHYSDSFHSFDHPDQPYNAPGISHPTYDPYGHHEYFPNYHKPCGFCQQSYPYRPYPHGTPHSPLDEYLYGRYPHGPFDKHIPAYHYPHDRYYPYQQYPYGYLPYEHYPHGPYPQHYPGYKYPFNPYKPYGHYPYLPYGDKVH